MCISLCRQYLHLNFKKIKKMSTSRNIFTNKESSFPTAAGIFFGLGLGGLVDTVILPRIINWHNTPSNALPITSIKNLVTSNFTGSMTASFTYTLTCVFFITAFILFWQASRTYSLQPSSPLLKGSLLTGWGTFNMIEGIMGHYLLNAHHAEGSVAIAYSIYWDICFLVTGVIMLAAGVRLIQQKDMKQITYLFGVNTARKNQIA
ncbi:DUF2243 domain-containing protein [Undibacterium pigrum]|uniref:Putative membrane protein n=1 Tax=Undibacterium pigrum TaxID=401470 RepID=A0A318JCZ5_9BURK|nr:DUF2243 domain-containing protein [Undibacterium pigrum]PXX46791.1 putative membrane protein [Undibacterium pigrum]